VTSPWVPATLVDAWKETPESRTLVLDAELDAALAGQSIDIRLTADDGYTAQRSYSLGSPAGAERFQVTVDRLEDGEVSPYLVNDLQLGHLVEVRGPVGRWFVWEPTQTEPIQLLAGGSGIVPLMSMIRARGDARGRQPFRLIHSVRSPADACYATELARRVRDDPGLDVRYVYTRETPEDWPEPPKRIGVATLNSHGWPPDFQPDCYVCGPTSFVETAADILVALGHDPRRIRTERFGGTS
jgi:ferredoxin-NADP reductase